MEEININRSSLKGILRSLRARYMTLTDNDTGITVRSFKGVSSDWYIVVTQAHSSKKYKIKYDPCHDKSTCVSHFGKSLLCGKPRYFCDEEETKLVDIPLIDLDW